MEIGLKEAGGVFERVRNQRRKEGRKEERTEGGGGDILDSSRMHRGSSRDQPRSSKRDYEKGGGCLNSWHRRLIHN